MVSGFDHDADDLDFSHLTCPYVTPGSGADKDKVAADEATNEDMPENREKLKRYIIGMEKHMLEQLCGRSHKGGEARVHEVACFGVLGRYRVAFLCLFTK